MSTTNTPNSDHLIAIKRVEELFHQLGENWKLKYLRKYHLLPAIHDAIYRLFDYADHFNRVVDDDILQEFGHRVLLPALQDVDTLTIEEYSKAIQKRSVRFLNQLPDANSF